MWFFIPKVSERFLSRCSELGIDYSYLHYLPPGRRIQNKAVVVRLQTPSQLSSLFWPNHFNSLYGTLFLGMRLPLQVRSEDIRMETGIPLFEGMPNFQNINGYFPPADGWQSNWVYSVKSDFSYFDSGDPLYCIPNQDSESFEREIGNALISRGYEIHVLPMIKPLILNWTDEGVIPVLA